MEKAMHSSSSSGGGSDLEMDIDDFAEGETRRMLPMSVASSSFSTPRRGAEGKLGSGRAGTSLRKRKGGRSLFKKGFFLFVYLVLALVGLRAAYLLTKLEMGDDGDNKVSVMSQQLDDLLSWKARKDSALHQLRAQVMDVVKAIGGDEADAALQSGKVEDIKTSVTRLSSGIDALAKERLALRSNVARISSIVGSMYDDSPVGWSMLHLFETQIAVTASGVKLSPCAWAGCRNASRVESLLHLLKCESGGSKIRIAHVGGCAPYISYALLSDCKDTISEYVSLFVNPPSDATGNCVGPLGAPPGATADFSSDDVRLKRVEDAEAYPQKHFDLLYLDPAFTSSLKSELAAWLETWLPKVKVGGIVAGHAYGVVPPSAANPNAGDTISGAMAWWKESEAYLEATRDFISGISKSFTKTISLAGDTFWYFEKKKASISDLFDDGNRRV